jgi:hypothetical protein
MDRRREIAKLDQMVYVRMTFEWPLPSDRSNDALQIQGAHEIWFTIRHRIRTPKRAGCGNAIGAVTAANLLEQKVGCLPT